MGKVQTLCAQLTKAVDDLLSCRQSVREGSEARAIRELEMARARLDKIREGLNNGM